MGKRGPKRLPSKVLENRGSWKAKGRSDVEVPVGKLKCPASLNEIGQQHWKDIVSDLEPTTILKAYDRHLLKLLCESHEKLEKWRALSENPIIKTSVKQTKKTDGTIEKSGGNVVTNPYLSSYNKEREHYERIAAIFFMGPANRSGMGDILGKGKNDDKARFFRKDE